MKFDPNAARRKGRATIQRALPEASGVLLDEVEAFDGMLTNPNTRTHDHLRIRAIGPEVDVRLSTSGPLDFALSIWRDVSRSISVMRTTFLETDFVATVLLPDAALFCVPKWKALKVPLFDAEPRYGLDFAGGALHPIPDNVLSLLRWNRPTPLNAVHGADADFLVRIQERFEVEFLRVPSIPDWGLE